MGEPALELHGIPHCDAVKKPRAWLEQRGISYRFHDFKKSGTDPGMLSTWLAQVSRETLINRRGTTWRVLDEADKARAAHADGALALMRDRASVIKRPVLVSRGRVCAVGFDATRFAALFTPSCDKSRTAV